MILVTSAKGGVGKSTIAINFQCFLSGIYAGHRIALVDADPNGHLHGATFFSRSEVVSAAPQNKETGEDALKRALAGLDGKDGASFAVVDSKPAMEPGERFALSLAELVIVPTLPAIGESQATLEVVRVARETRDKHGDGLPRIAIAPNCWDNGAEAGPALELLQMSGELILPPIFRRDPLRQAMREKGTALSARGMVGKEMKNAFWAALNLFKSGEIDARLQ